MSGTESRDVNATPQKKSVLSTITELWATAGVVDMVLAAFGMLFVVILIAMAVSFHVFYTKYLNLSSGQTTVADEDALSLAMDASMRVQTMLPLVLAIGFILSFLGYRFWGSWASKVAAGLGILILIIGFIAWIYLAFVGGDAFIKNFTLWPTASGTTGSNANPGQDYAEIVQSTFSTFYYLYFVVAILGLVGSALSIYTAYANYKTGSDADRGPLVPRKSPY